jgi:hypothetical protein
MSYIREESKVIYKSKDGRQQKAFDALEWLAAMSSHIPDKGEQMVLYYGYYSNVCRGRRQKKNQEGVIPYIIEQGENSKEYRRNWARLIQKIYEVDPLACPRCQGKMSIISFIENEELITKDIGTFGALANKKKAPTQGQCPTRTNPLRLLGLPDPIL